MAVNAGKTDEAPDELETPSGLLNPPKDHAEALFGGEAKSLVVTKDVQVHQLMAEIDERLGDRKKYHVVGHLEDDDRPVSEKNPLTLYVHGGADLRTVRGAVESHERDDHYGLSDEERRINELKDRLRSGDDLPGAELNELLRAMIGE